MLRKIRIALAIPVFLIINCLFLGITFGLHNYLVWAARIQFLPAVMATSVGVIAFWIVISLLFGRIYCSTVCPLGVMQDGFAWLGKKQKKNRYFHSKEKRWLRYSVWAVFVICVIIGFAPVTTLLAPYSAYGRIVNSLFRPLYDLLGNGLAMIESNYESYHFSEVQIWMRSVTVLVVALLTLFCLAILAWRNGRTYCNTICPVGTTLSFFSRFALFRIQFNKDKCKNCSLCERNCKTSAIDFRAGTVDYSRCVACGDCVSKCKFDALHYELRKQPIRATAIETSKTDEKRRAFLAGTAMAVASSAVAQKKIKVDRGLAVIEDKQRPVRQTPILPPGAVSQKNMQRHCTACQLCVSKCPNNVLRPSSDPLRFMQPESSYERGYCKTGCTRCSSVCPTGAIKHITREEKTAIHIGKAVWVHWNCVPLRDGVECGNCARHCPTGAITMVEMQTKDGTHRVPSVDESKCIGCGACENLCPARPFSAIYVEGYTQHIID